ncbi:MAG: AAA family ATPase [Lachnospiraceae bacterium]
MNITSGILKKASKVVVYGPEGIGKSTFASRFPDPIFIDTEGSTGHMNVRRYDKPSSWSMLLEEVNYTLIHKPCKTLIIDTVDWAEQLCIESICAEHQKSGIEDFGYGNGYVYVKEEFGRFLNKLQEVVDAGIHVVLTAHAQIRKFEQPDEMGAYDRYELKLGKKTSSQTSPLVKEWCDMLLFANYRTFSIATDKDGKKHKAQGGQRVMYTTHHPCWDAKNRYDLGDCIPFEYSQIESIVECGTNLNDSRVPEPAPVQQPAVTPQTDMTPQPDATPQPTTDIPSQTTVHGTNTQPEPGPQSPPVSEPEPVQQTLSLQNEQATRKQEERSSPPIGQVSELIPKALRDLMLANNVDEWDIQNVVAAKGYYPSDTPISNYDPAFISGVLVGAWQQVFAMIKTMKEKESIPFN